MITLLDNSSGKTIITPRMNNGKAVDEQKPLLFLGLAAAIAAIGWGLIITGILKVPDGILYDAFLNVVPSERREEPGILLVELDDITGTEEVALAQRLATNGASRIIFTYLPSGKQNTNLLTIGAPVAFGRGFVWNLANPEMAELEPVPAGLPLASVAVNAIPLPAHGVHRRHSYSVKAGDDLYPSLEAVIAGVTNRLGSYLVNFMQTGERLPRIDAQRALSGGLVPELVRGKTVLVGLTRSANGFGLSTPIHSATEPISPLEFRGFALNTLISGKIIRELNGVATTVLLFTLSFGCAVAYARLQRRHEVRVFLAATCILLAVSWAVLIFGRLSLSTTSLLLAHAGVFFFVQHQKGIIDSHAMDEVLRDLSFKLLGRQTGKHFETNSDPWGAIARMIEMGIGPVRSVFWEVIPTKERLSLAKSFGIEPGDIIVEVRVRSLPPFSSSLAAGRPVPVEPLFRALSPGEQSFLAPLLFEGELQGFWGFSLPASVAGTFPDTLLKRYANDAARLLLLYRNKQSATLRNSSFGRRYAGFNRIERHVILKNSIHLLESHLRTLENAFEGASAAGAVFDLFGNVLYSNTLMRDATQSAGIPSLEISPVEIISKLAKISTDQARHSLRYVFVKREAIVFPVEILNGSLRHFFLRAAPAFQGGQKRALNERADGELEGLLLELKDVTQLRATYEVRQRLVTHLGFQLRNDMEAFTIGASLLGDPTLGPEERVEVQNIFNEKVEEATSILNEAHKLLEEQMDESSSQRYPVDPRGPVIMALEALRGPVSAHGLKLETQVPDFFASLVFASSEGLGQMTQSVLEFLFRDTVSGGAIRIAAHEREESVIYEFSNTGFGMQNDRLQAAVFGAEEAPTREFTKLRLVADQVKVWRGQFTVVSTPGEGTAFTICLEAFL